MTDNERPSESADNELPSDSADNGQAAQTPQPSSTPEPPTDAPHAEPTGEGASSADAASADASSAGPTRPEAPRVDEHPTGEVVTGPIRYTPDPTTQAYSQAPKPSTKQMDALDSGAFSPIPSAPAEPAAPPSGPVMTSPMTSSSKRGRGRTIGLVLAAVVLLVVIAGVGTELYVRNKVTSCLQTSFDNLTGAETDVSVSRRPMLLAMLGGDVPWVQVDTTSGGDSTMRLHARAEGISTDGGTVRQLDGNGFLPYERIKALTSEQQSGGTTIDSIEAKPADGTMKISTTVTLAILPVPATVTLKPVVNNGAVTFEVTDATALMFGLPKDFAQPIVDQVTDAMFGPLFKQIQVSKLTIAKNGIDFAFSGSDVNLKSASEQTGQNTGGGCAV